MNLPFPIRQECPPGACMCDRDRLLADPAADVRILRLTKEEEKRLVARLENITSLEDLRAMQGRMQAQLGIVVVPGIFYGESCSQYVRFSITATDDKIAEGARRLRDAIGLV